MFDFHCFKSLLRFTSKIFYFWEICGKNRISDFISNVFKFSVLCACTLCHCKKFRFFGCPLCTFFILLQLLKHYRLQLFRTVCYVLIPAHHKIVFCCDRKWAKLLQTCSIHHISLIVRKRVLQRYVWDNRDIDTLTLATNFVTISRKTGACIRLENSFEEVIYAGLTK